MFKHFFATLLILLALAFILPARAEMKGLMVYPERLELDFTQAKGKFVSKVISVENTTDNNLRVAASIQAWDLDQYGSVVFRDTPDERGMNDYIRFNPGEFDIAPGQKQLVRITARLPEGIDGEFRSMIFFETMIKKGEHKKLKKGEIGIAFDINARYGVALYGYKGNLTRNILLENFKYQKIEDRNYLVASLKNTGNTHCSLKVDLDLENHDRQIPNNKTVQLSYVILPGRSQDMRIELPESELPAGNYTAKISYMYQDADGKDITIPAKTGFLLENNKFAKTELKGELVKAKN